MFSWREFKEKTDKTGIDENQLFVNWLRAQLGMLPIPYGGFSNTECGRKKRGNKKCIKKRQSY